MEMELEFLDKNFTEIYPESLTDQIKSAASGEAPFLPVILSLVYDMLAEKSFPKDAPPNSGTSQVPANHGPTIPASFQTSGFTVFTTPFQASSSASTTTSTPTQKPSASGFVFPTPLFGISRSPRATTPPTTFSFSSPRVPVPAPTPGPSGTPTGVTPPMCTRCRSQVGLARLYNSLHCPRCTENGNNGREQKGRPFMFCSGCNKNVDQCLAKGKCSATIL